MGPHWEPWGPHGALKSFVLDFAWGAHGPHESLKSFALDFAWGPHGPPWAPMWPHGGPWAPLGGDLDAI